MRRSTAGATVAVVASSLLVSACQGSSSTSTADASPQSDGGRDAAKDAREDVRDAREDARDTAVDVPPPIRVATTRGLLPTSVENLLLDPFVTYDQSWGHFILVDPATGTLCTPLVREVSSQSPIGVSGAVVRVSLLGNCTQILAPMPGASSGSVLAQMWISLSDASGNPLPFPSAAALDAAIKVELVPNYLPTQMPQNVYPLAPVSVSLISPAEAGTPPLTIAGREWGLVGLAATPFTQGGWLVITLVSATGSFYLAAPEVVPTEVVPLVLPRSRALTDADRRAAAGYQRASSTHSTPRRSFGAH